VPNIEPLATPEPEPFACPNCGARYTLVRADADREAHAGRSKPSSPSPTTPARPTAVGRRSLSTGRGRPRLKVFVRNAW
jgi:hypothetical protein